MNTEEDVVMVMIERAQSAIRQLERESEREKWNGNIGDEPFIRANIERLEEFVKTLELLV